MLGERLRVLQWVAVGIGLVASVYLTIASGRVPYAALALAMSSIMAIVTLETRLLPISGTT